jgi:hypothetical protein
MQSCYVLCCLPQLIRARNEPSGRGAQNSANHWPEYITSYRSVFLTLLPWPLFWRRPSWGWALAHEGSNPSPSARSSPDNSKIMLPRCLYSPSCREKLSEKSRRCLERRGPTDRQKKGLFGPFCRPYTGQINGWSILRSLLGQFLSVGK